MVFYLDIILLLNLIIDYFILLASSKFLHLQYKKWRLALGACVGACYTLIIFIPFLKDFHLLLTKFLISIVMVLISYGFIHLIQFIQTVATFYFISFLTGGGVFAIQYLLDIEHDVINGVYISKSSNPFIVVFLIIIAFFGIWLFSNKSYKSMHRKINIANKIVNVDIYINNNIYPFIGLVDTGNRLYDPVSRKPVMIIEAEDTLFIPKYFKNAYIDGQFQLDLFDKITDKIDNYLMSRIHLVPYRSISSKMQFILAIRPDKVVIKIDKEKVLSRSSVLIGLNYGQLSNDKTYNAIVHPELFVS